MRERAKFALIGALAGGANGFFGAGGGLFLVPLLLRWGHLPERQAFATSVAVIFPLSLLSAVVYFLRGGGPPTGILPYLAGGAAGGLIGGRLFRSVSLPLLRRAFALLLLYGGVRAVLLL